MFSHDVCICIVYIPDVALPGIVGLHFPSAVLNWIPLHCEGERREGGREGEREGGRREGRSEGEREGKGKVKEQHLFSITTAHA